MRPGFGHPTRERRRSCCCGGPFVVTCCAMTACQPPDHLPGASRLSTCQLHNPQSHDAARCSWRPQSASSGWATRRRRRPVRGNPASVWAHNSPLQDPLTVGCCWLPVIRRACFRKLRRSWRAAANVWHGCLAALCCTPPSPAAAGAQVWHGRPSQLTAPMDQAAGLQGHACGCAHRAVPLNQANSSSSCCGPAAPSVPLVWLVPTVALALACV